MITLALACLALQSDARPLSTAIRDVTVFADRALVHRAADVPAGGGKFVVAGLPIAADPAQVRVRCTGGDVTNVDVTEVRAPALPDARREELRRDLVDLGREAAAMDDERKLLESGAASVAELLKPEAGAAKPEQAVKLDVGAWAKEQDQLLSRLRAQKQALRELAERRAEVERRRQELQSAGSTT